MISLIVGTLSGDEVENMPDGVSRILLALDIQIAAVIICVFS